MPPRIVNTCPRTEADSPSTGTAVPKRSESHDGADCVSGAARNSFDAIDDIAVVICAHPVVQRNRHRVALAIARTGKIVLCIAEVLATVAAHMPRLPPRPPRH